MMTAANARDAHPQFQPDAQRRLAADLFNLVWRYMEKPTRTPEENDVMLHAAHASRYHWGAVGEPVNFARGEWQVSRVYAVLQRAEPALHHARRCLEVCERHAIGDFDLAFAHEALARAHAVAGHAAERDRHLALARQAAEGIRADDDRELLLSDLATITA